MRETFAQEEGEEEKVIMQIEYVSERLIEREKEREWKNLSCITCWSGPTLQGKHSNKRKKEREKGMTFGFFLSLHAVKSGKLVSRQSTLQLCHIVVVFSSERNPSWKIG